MSESGNAKNKIHGKVVLDSARGRTKSGVIQVLSGMGVKLFSVKKVDGSSIKGNNDGMTIFTRNLVAGTRTDEKGEYEFLVDEGSYCVIMDIDALPEGMKAMQSESRVDSTSGKAFDFKVRRVNGSVPARPVLKPISKESSMPETASITKIRLDFENGLIDEKTKILHYLNAIFNHERLSEGYKSSIPVKSGSTAVKEIHDYIRKPDSDKDVKETAKRYIADAVPALDKAYDSKGGFFRIHYTLNGANAVPETDTNGNGVPDYIESMGTAFDSTRSVTCGTRGFRVPLLDPGEKAFHVYVYDLKGKYGITFPSKFYGAGNFGPRRSSSYISIDNSYSTAKGFKKGRDECMKVTVAHEFFHAVQNAYNADADSWWKEASATWNEDEVYRGINDYLRYLGSVFSSPEKPLERNSYGGVVFAKYLSENMGGYGMIKRIWEVQAEVSRNSINAIDAAIKERNPKEDIGSVFNRYTACNFSPEQYYEQGHLWTSHISIKNTYSAYPVEKQKGSLNHLSSCYNLFKSDSTKSDSTLRIVVDGEEGKKWGLKIQKRRRSDDKCDITEIPIEVMASRAEILCSNFGETYKEICLIPANVDKTRDGISYTYSADLKG